MTLMTFSRLNEGYEHDVDTTNFSYTSYSINDPLKKIFFLHIGVAKLLKNPTHFWFPDQHNSQSLTN